MAQDFITRARTQARKLWDAYETLKSMQDEWNALALGDTLPAGTGANVGITKAEVGPVVFDVTDAIKAVMDDGNATSVCKLL